MILCIDPGPETSGIVLVYESYGRLAAVHDGHIKLAEETDIDRIRFLIQGDHEVTVHRVLCEDVTPQMTIGVETLDTKERVGEIKEMCRSACIPFQKIARRDVKAALALGKATDAVVIQELHSRGWTKGTKKAPGPAYLVKGHCWQALALYVAFLEIQKEKSHAP